MQLCQLRRTHVVPEDEESLRSARLARWGMTKDPVAELDKQWRRHNREVRRLHEKLFYRPLLDAVAKLPGDEARLTPEAAQPAAVGARLRRPGRRAAPPRGADQRASRGRAASSAQLLPAMLGWFADGPNPDAGLLGFRQISDALGCDALVPADAARRGRGRRSGSRMLLASSRYATDLLQRAPDGGARCSAPTRPGAARRARRCAGR